SPTRVAAMLGDPLTSAARPVLDRAGLAAYAAKGINSDPATGTRPAPWLAEMVEQLAISAHPEGEAIADRLAPYVVGSYKDLFASATTTRPDGHLVVFSLRDLPEEVKSVGEIGRAHV